MQETWYVYRSETGGRRALDALSGVLVRAAVDLAGYRVRLVRYASDGPTTIGRLTLNAFCTRGRVYGEGEDGEDEEDVESELHDDLRLGVWEYKEVWGDIDVHEDLYSPQAREDVSENFSSVRRDGDESVFKLPTIRLRLLLKPSNNAIPKPGVGSDFGRTHPALVQRARIWQIANINLRPLVNYDHGAEICVRRCTLSKKGVWTLRQVCLISASRYPIGPTRSNGTLEWRRFCHTHAAPEIVTVLPVTKSRFQTENTGSLVCVAEDRGLLGDDC